MTNKNNIRLKELQNYILLLTTVRDVGSLKRVVFAEKQGGPKTSGCRFDAIPFRVQFIVKLAV